MAERHKNAAPRAGPERPGGWNRRQFLGCVGATAALSGAELSLAPSLMAQGGGQVPRLSAAGRPLPRLREMRPQAEAVPQAPVPLTYSAGNENVVELRLALVCYGGVSLAIYMHGITKELARLVVASRGFEDSPEVNPFPEDRVEHHYWLALKQSAETTGVARRVIIDILSGTSAGGINSVFLAKALARDLSQEPLTSLWLTKADLWKLLGGNRLRGTLRLAAFAAELPVGKAKPPLDGDALFRWLVAALAEMDDSPQPLPAHYPLQPAGQPLQLFVTATDYYGYRLSMLLSDPPMVSQTWNRNILEFVRPPVLGAGEADVFAAGNNPALAFAARATSSYPGAFPPFGLPDVARNLRLMQHPPRQDSPIAGQLFRRYELAGADPAKTFFIDGGVLDSYPFQPAIDAIVRRTAASEVDRRLIYLDPDPALDEPAQAAAGAAPPNQPATSSAAAAPAHPTPSFYGTVWAGLSSLPAAQPIVDQLQVVRAFNERVRFVNALVAASSAEVSGLLLGILKDGGLTRLEALDLTSIGEWRHTIEDEAKKQAGYLYESYFQLRVAAVVAQLAAVVNALCRYPPDTNSAYLVQLIVEAWARRSRLLPALPSQPAPPAPAAPEAPEDIGVVDRALQENLVAVFDLGFTRRRLAFVIQGLNELYDHLPPGGRPSRAEVNETKATLYHFVDRLESLIGGDALDSDLASQVRELFTTPPFPVPPAGQPFDRLAEQFVAAGSGRLKALQTRIGDFVFRQHEAAHDEMLGELNRLTAAWEAGVRREVLVRYLGFPFWDALIYPTTRLVHAGELRELNVVRFSPADATTLGTAGAAKLQGTRMYHFGAFFTLEARQNDYLWGRLDAADRIFHLLLPAPRRQEVAGALRAILGEERPKLSKVQATVADLTARCERLMA